MDAHEETRSVYTKHNGTGNTGILSTKAMGYSRSMFRRVSSPLFFLVLIKKLDDGSFSYSWSASMYLINGRAWLRKGKLLELTCDEKRTLGYCYMRRSISHVRAMNPEGIIAAWLPSTVYSCSVMVPPRELSTTLGLYRSFRHTLR